jgi:four helix bundle protein
MADAKGFFDFEKLTVYQRTLEFADLVFSLCRKMAPEYRSSVADGLQRAVVSISNNIAGGAGKLSHREKIKYFSYALDSAKECVPPLTIARRQEQISDGELASGRDHCETICKMLVKLIQSVEARELSREVREDPSLYQ